MLIVRRIYTNDAPLLDELTLISVNVYENKAMKIYNLVKNQVRFVMYMSLCRECNWTTMHAHELVNYDLEFDLTYTPIEEEIISMLDEKDAATDNEHIKEVGDVQIRDVVVNKA